MQHGLEAILKAIHVANSARISHFTQHALHFTSGNHGSKVISLVMPGNLAYTLDKNIYKSKHKATNSKQMSPWSALNKISFLAGSGCRCMNSKKYHHTFAQLQP